MPLALIAALVAVHAGAETQAWLHQKIAVVLFPFGAGAMAVNVFFLSHWIMDRLASLVCDSFHFSGLCRRCPSDMVFCRAHIRELMDQADEMKWRTKKNAQMTTFLSRYD
jgi:hypothetical protein